MYIGYVPDNIEIIGSPSQNVPNSDLKKKSWICRIWGQSDILWAQIWPSLFRKVYIKQKSDLDDAQEITTVLTYFNAN